MNSKLPHFEKYLVAPSPSRDYYGIKVLDNKVILYLWKVSYGPHLFPIVKVTEFSKFNEDKFLKDEIQQVFGSNLLNYLQLLISGKRNTLLALPTHVHQKLVKYLNLEDITKLFCVSQVSNEIFNSKAIWEIFCKKWKRKSQLTEMERNLNVSQGFKQFIKDQQTCSTSKNNCKLIDDDFSCSQKSTSRSEKALLSDKTAQNNVKNISSTKHSIEGNSRKNQRPPKPLVRASFESQEKIYDVSRKYILETKPPRLVNSQNFIEKYSSGEGYQKHKSSNEKMRKSKSKQNDELQKFKFVNEDNEQTELLLRKKYLKSIIFNSDIDDDTESSGKRKEETKKKNSTLLSPRSIFTKSSCQTLHELKSKPRKKSMHESNSKVSNNANFNLKSLMQDDKNDDSDGSGMSYLMKKYLQATDEAARKFSKYESGSYSKKNSNIQTNISENAEHRPIEKAQKYISSIQRSRSVNEDAAANIFSKLKPFKKN